eukprot:CAMPEP_0118874020 /NCGR_PEP_ID=MMETSP1163-20130328/15616_1 /TAXON_ID=124430 /ORGANISM="Phaeomonas parva, Strain CCMP2877" /LENGTH=86 /DNA_ID=CAMNT_0006809351 /DNA_START=1 /DNA_END=258 /DNA_ORIENTATION=-
MIVKLDEDDPTKAYFVTQRATPSLATIHPNLPANPNAGVILTGSRPDAPPPLEVPVVHDGKEIAVNVWSSPVLGTDQGGAAAAWLE